MAVNFLSFPRLPDSSTNYYEDGYCASDILTCRPARVFTNGAELDI
jgi:hypothetical protein